MDTKSLAYRYFITISMVNVQVRSIVCFSSTSSDAYSEDMLCHFQELIPLSRNSLNFHHVLNIYVEENCIYLFPPDKPLCGTYTRVVVVSLNHFVKGQSLSILIFIIVISYHLFSHSYHAHHSILPF